MYGKSATCEAVSGISEAGGAVRISGAGGEPCFRGTAEAGMDSEGATEVEMRFGMRGSLS